MQVHFETTQHLLNQCPVFTIFINASILWNRDSVVGIATRYRLDGPGDQIPVGVRFSSPVQTGSKPHPASYNMGTGSFPEGVKWPGHGADNPPASSAEVNERVQLGLCGLF